MLLSEKDMANAVNWLLTNAGPSIRYRTLTELLHRSAEDCEVQKAYSEILGSRRLLEIAAQQNSEGSFGKKSYYHGTDTTEDYLRELFELGVTPDHPVLRQGLALRNGSVLPEPTQPIGWLVC